MASLPWRNEEASPPKPARASSPARQYRTVRSVVAAENHNGVVVDARFLDRIEDLPDAEIHFADNLGVEPARLVFEVRIRHDGLMHFRIAQVNEERLLRGRIPLDEVDRLGDKVFLIHDGTDVLIQGHRYLGRLALATLQDVGRNVEQLRPLMLGEHLLRQGVVCRILRVRGFVPSVRDTPPFVEAFVVRQTPLNIAEVPFAIQSRSVSCLG
jgi:hypothetical protein